MELKVTTYDVAARIATITLNRPERLNAWTGRLEQEYRHLLRTAAQDPAVRVIIVTGAGRGFCAGADVAALEGHLDRGSYDSGTSDDLEWPGSSTEPAFQANFAYHFAVEKPIIAMINGPAAGVGFALACYCDLRFAAAGSKLTTAHGRLGLPAEFGLSWLLPRLIGVTAAADLLLSSRIVLAEEALALGLLNRCVAPDELDAQVRAYATVLATEVSPASMAASKRQLYLDLHRGAVAAIAESETLLRQMIPSPDYLLGVEALAARRRPNF